MDEKIPQQISSIQTLFLHLPPSCIEFWHLHPNYFVIGTYLLHQPEQEQGESTKGPSEEDPSSKPPQKRTGSLILCKFVENKIEIINTCKTDYAILDLHFVYENKSNQRKQTNFFYTANSTGSVAAYELVFPEKWQMSATPTIERRSLFQLWEEEILVLSFCWHHSDPTLMSATLSNGEVYVLRKGMNSLDGSPTWLKSTKNLPSHELEAWTSCFAPTGAGLLLSGGDDGIMQYTASPTEFRDETCPMKLCDHDHESGTC